MSSKSTLAILFGGRSVEHEVSILTGYQVIEAADINKYDIRPVYLSRDNVWFTGRQLASLDFFRQDVPPLNQLSRVYPAPDAARGKLALIECEPPALRRAKVWTIDCVLPATHGAFVEDGCLQGLLELANVPYVGSNVAGSTIGMDKLITKSILKSAGLPCLPYEAVYLDEWQKQPAKTLQCILTAFDFPLMVKPAALGSSIAISRADNPDGLSAALDLALRFCPRALVEPALRRARDINCSVIDGDPPIPSILEQPVRQNDLLTFDEKYRGGSKGKVKGKSGSGMAAQQRLIPAPLDEATTKYIQDLAVRTFTTSQAGGVARIDFLIKANANANDNDNDNVGEWSIYINEINNIPGSLSFYLWEAMGKSFRELIDRLVERAYEVHRRRNRITYNLEVNLLAPK
ncbi:MAG: D-alanine--D-alanine ligase [Calditrichaeota bacterium]|nr:D-alanine--D-alanine ligase [Calditrichota bacterium]